MAGMVAPIGAGASSVDGAKPAALPAATMQSVEPSVRGPLEGIEVHAMRAARTGHAYRVFVAPPRSPPPPQGHPVVVVLDADLMFATAVEAMRTQTGGGRSSRMQEAIIVGIAHPGTGRSDPAARARDFAPPQAAPATASPPSATEEGDDARDAFLAFLVDELRPALARRFHVDSARHTLIGHSLGGLFVLHALFTRPDAFSVHVAASPSLWWNEARMREEEQRFLDARHADAARPRVLITVGSLEQPSPDTRDPAARQRAAVLAERRMVDNARRLAERLERHGIDAAFVEFADENHGSVIPAAVSRALRFALESPFSPAGEGPGTRELERR